jgi:putative ABC transport system ATP-binding protein
MKNKIQISDVSVLKNTQKILDSVSSSILDGERVLVHGCSGAGKSTLLKCLLLFEDISSGNIIFNNEIVNENNVASYRLNFAYISQKLPYYYGTAKEFLFLPKTFKNNRDLIISYKEIEYYFNKLSLNMDLLKKEYNRLSDGEKQRVCIVQALLLERKFMILDEATSNLDLKNKERVVDLLSDKGVTVITVSHDQCWDNAFTKKIILEDGRMVKEIIK